MLRPCVRKEEALLGKEPTQLDSTSAKKELLKVVSNTFRGQNTNAIKRGVVAEAQAAVEAFSSAFVDWNLLQGTWDVVYSTAPDVVGLLQPLNGLPLRVGKISQRFSSVQLGSVENIIELHAGSFAVDEEPVMVRCVVQAEYSVRTARSISLMFKNAGFSRISFSQYIQDVLAPALLPRGWWNLALLEGLQQIQEVGIFMNNEHPWNDYHQE